MSSGAAAADARRLLVGVAAATRIRRETDLRISQEELSRRCGFGRHYVGAIERVEATLDVHRLASLAEALRFEGLVDLFVCASEAAARLEAAGSGPVEAGGCVDGRSR